MSGPGADGLRAQQRPSESPSALLDVSLFIPSLAPGHTRYGQAHGQAGLLLCAGQACVPADSVLQGPDAQIPPDLGSTRACPGRKLRSQSPGGPGRGSWAGGWAETCRGQDAWSHLPAAGWSEGALACTSVDYWWRQDIHPRPRCGGRASATAAGHSGQCRPPMLSPLGLRTAPRDELWFLERKPRLLWPQHEE